MTVAQASQAVPPSWLAAVGEVTAANTLPTAGLTLLELASPDGKRHGHWSTAIVPLALEALRSGQSVFFVECGGYGGSTSGEDLAAAASNNPALIVHKDEDVVVFTPPIMRAQLKIGGPMVTVDGRLMYKGYVPTLHNIELELRAHDSNHGASLVIFDEVEMTRPYWDVTDDGGSAPLRLPVQQADGWRATDLVSFAEGRRSPTLLVSDRPEQFSGRSALLEVSLAHAVVLMATDGQSVEVSFTHRPTLTDRWPKPDVVRVDIYEC